MQFKLLKIKGCKTCGEVLLVRQRTDEGEDYVQIVAWHESEDGLFLQEEEVRFSSEEILTRYIADFSEASANVFANKMTF